MGTPLSLSLVGILVVAGHFTLDMSSPGEVLNAGPSGRRLTW